MHQSKVMFEKQADIIGVSPWACRTRDFVCRMASRTASVLIQGPTGTGKELIARALHTQGMRFPQLFVPVDCTVVSGPLFASQLFGHLRGAFTDAVRDSVGSFRAADGGTIFLDEIGELEPECQAKLLRVLQQRTVTPVGSHDEIPVNVRVVAATHRNLAEDVESGRFRADLYYRLNVLNIEATPLRSRPEDILVLATHFLREIAVLENESPRSLAPEAISELMAHPWPGNVRHLRNAIERAVAFADGPVLHGGLLEGGLLEGAAEYQDGCMQSTADLPARQIIPFHETAPSAGNVAYLATTAQKKAFRMPTSAETERLQVLTAMKIANDNQSHAAAMLGVSRQQLRRRIEKHFPDALPAKRGRPQRERSQRTRAA